MTRRTILKLTGLSLVSALVGCDGNNASAGDSNPAPTSGGQAGSSPATRESAMSNAVSVKVFNDRGQLVGPITMPKVIRSDAEWKVLLNPNQYKIARAKGTEPAFCGTLLDNHLDGVYACVCCGLPLFSSDSKFNSGTGWPSFFQPVAKENVIEHEDDSYGMRRTEILCARCDCHLGHVFEDGPRPTGLRFCVNSESLKFTPADKLTMLADPAAANWKGNSPATQPARP